MKPTNTNAQEVEAHLVDEHAADLASLEAAAGVGGEGITEGAQAATVDAVMVPLDREIAGAVMMLVGVLSPAFPSLKEIYNEGTAMAVGGAVAGVCNKHGWLQGGIGGEYGPELACAMVVLPLGFATYQGIKKDIAARAPKPQEPSGGGIVGTADISAPVPENAGAVGSKHAGFGAPIAHANG